MSDFMKEELGEQEFRTKLIKREGTLLGANFRLPPKDAPEGTITIDVPMTRVIGSNRRASYRRVSKGKEKKAAYRGRLKAERVQEIIRNACLLNQ